MTTEKKLVWDLPLRVFHWLFGINILLLWYTAEQGLEQYHIWLGFFIIGLLIFRLCWGIWGSKHSQFRHFFPTPKSIIQYMKDRCPETIGHNPMGSIVVFIMFGMVGLQAFTGLFTFGELWAGPYASALGEDITKKLESIHHIIFDYLLWIMGLHVVAAFVYLFIKKQNLILPMITGYKKQEVVPEGEGISSSKLWIAGITLIVVAGFVYWCVFVNPPPVIYDDYYY